jgi:BTB/POZ domain-containing adapter for CUL3-mediated RhoA degradation protein
MLRSRNQDERSDRRRTSTASSRDEEIEETLQRIQKQGKYVKLNVGGVLYCTTLGTLTKHDNMLRAMFSERIPLQKDEEGWVIIDRSGKHFGSILNFIRDDFMPLPDSKAECLEVLAEAKYYCIAELVEQLEDQLERLRDDYHKICRVPVITSLDEETRIVSTSMKVYTCTCTVVMCLLCVMSLT